MLKITFILLILFFNINSSYAEAILNLKGKVSSFTETSIDLETEKHVYRISRKFIPADIDKKINKLKRETVSVSIPLRGILKVVKL